MMMVFPLALMTAVPETLNYFVETDWVVRLVVAVHFLLDVARSDVALAQHSFQTPTWEAAFLMVFWH